MQILMFRSCKSAIVRPVRFESLSTGLMLTPAKSCLSIYFWIAYMMKCVLLAKPCLAPMDCQWLNRDRFGDRYLRSGVKVKVLALFK